MICYNCGWNNPARQDRCEKCGEVLKEEEIFREEAVGEEVVEEYTNRGNEASMAVDVEETAGETSKEKAFSPDFLKENEVFYYKYTLRKKLNPGGKNNEVWLAKDIDTGQDIVLKIAVSTSLLVRERLKEEFVKLYALHHDHVVHADFFGIYKDLPFYVMPYYSGGDASLLEGKVDEAIARKFLEDVVQGLSYLHARKIVHGNVMPENVLIDSAGRFVLCGFGCSDSYTRKVIAGQESNYAYIAPELLDSSPSFDTPVDIWALGVSLGKLVTGKLMCLDTNKEDVNITVFYSYLRSRGHITRKDPRSEYERIQTLNYFFMLCFNENRFIRITAQALCFLIGLRIVYSRQLQKYGVIRDNGVLVADFIYDKIDYFGYRCIPGSGPGPISHPKPWFFGAYFERGIYCGYLKWEGNNDVYERDVCTEEEHKARCMKYT